mgnify:FL=1
MCDHQQKQSARVCVCGVFVPARDPGEHKVRRYGKPTNVMVGVSGRPVRREPDESNSRLYPLGVFDYTRMDTVRPSYEDDAGGSFDNCRRLREDGYPENPNFNTLS